MPLLSDDEYKSYMKYKKEYTISYSEGSKFKRIVQRIQPHQVIGILLLIIGFMLFIEALKVGDVTTDATLGFIILIVVITYSIIR